jgi:hypothetical protein
MALENVAQDADDPLAQDHLLRQIVAEPLEDACLPLLPAALAAHPPPILSFTDMMLPSTRAAMLAQHSRRSNRRYYFEIS